MKNSIKYILDLKTYIIPVMNLYSSGVGKDTTDHFIFYSYYKFNENLLTIFDLFKYKNIGTANKMHEYIITTE